MDNTEGLGAAMEASYQRDRARSQEQRIQVLEEQVRLLSQAVMDLARSLSVIRAGL